MWVKVFKDGTKIQENRDHGITWMTTPLDNLQEVFIINGIFKSQALSGYDVYWHSRTGVSFEDGKNQILVERIQGLRDDGKWDTIEMYPDGSTKTMIYENAIGKPVYK